VLLQSTCLLCSQNSTGAPSATAANRVPVFCAHKIPWVLLQSSCRLCSQNSTGAPSAASCQQSTCLLCSQNSTGAPSQYLSSVLTKFLPLGQSQVMTLLKKRRAVNSKLSGSHRVVWLVVANVSEEYSVRRCEDRGSSTS
jgi:hypothetical protein